MTTSIDEALAEAHEERAWAECDIDRHIAATNKMEWHPTNREYVQALSAAGKAQTKYSTLTLIIEKLEAERDAAEEETAP